MKKILHSSAFSLLLALTGALALSGLTGGCATSGGDKPVADDDITATVKSDLSHDSILNSTGIRVSTLSGVVHLRGYAQSETQKTMAEKDAAAVGGVKSVVNDLVVSAGN